MNAPHDQNFVKAKLGVLFSDGVTLIPIALDSVTSKVKVNMSDSVSPTILNLYINGKPIPRDANHNPAWCAESSTDSSVIFPIFVDSTGAILIDL